MKNWPDTKEDKMRLVLKPSFWQFISTWSTVVFLIALAALGIVIASIAHSNTTTINSQIGDITTDLDNVLVSVIVNGPAAKMVMEKNSNEHKRLPAVGPPTLPLPLGFTAFHTANCYYQNGLPLSLYHLADVEVTGAMAGNVLGFDGTDWVPQSSLGMSSLGDIGDVMLTALATNEVVAWNGVRWVNQLIVANNVDESAIQLRVTGSCPASSKIRVINDDGTVICDDTVGPDKISSANVVDGSLLSIDTDTSSIQARVTGTCGLAGEYIKSIDAAGAVTCSSALAMNSVNSATIVDGSIAAVDVDNTAIQLRVTGTCPAGSQMRIISDTGTVTCDSTVAAGEVDTAQLVNLAVTTAKLDDLSVTTGKLASGAVTNAKIGVGEVNSASVQDGSLVIGDMDSSSVQARVTGTCAAGSQIASISATGTVTCDNTVAANQVDTLQIVDSAVTTNKIDNLAVTNAKLAMDAVTSGKILDGTVAEVDLVSAYARGVANGVCPLNAMNKIDAAFLPAIAIGTVTVCADITCRNALSPNVGDICKVVNAFPINPDSAPETFIWDGAAWIEIMDSDVLTVNAKTGHVVLGTDDISEGATNLYFTQVRVSANADVITAVMHAGVVTGNPHALDMNDLTDVDTTGVSVGEVLEWSGTQWLPVTPAPGGESNTGSNVNMAGIGVFKQKTGVDLEFRGVVAASGRASVTLDAPTNEIRIDVVEAIVQHDNLGGFVATEHIDHVSLFVNAGTGLSGGGNLVSSVTLNLNAQLNELTDVIAPSIPTLGSVLTYTGGGWNAVAAGAGEANTGVNINTMGIGLFQGKSGVNLQFYGVDEAPGNRMSLSLNGLTNAVEFDIVEANVMHNNLGGYVATEHVDHAALMVNAGTGLSGGGTLTSSVTLNLNAALSLLTDVDNTLGTTVNNVLTYSGGQWTDLPPTIVTQEEGVTVGGGPHTTLNFVGVGSTVTDGGGGVATVDTNPTYFALSATALTTTTSGTFTSMAGMSQAGLPAGTYFVSWSASGNHNDADSDPEIGIFIGAISGASIPIAGSLREYFGNGGNDNAIQSRRWQFHTQGVAVLGATNSIGIGWNDGGAGTFTMYDRHLFIWRIA